MLVNRFSITSNPCYIWPVLPNVLLKMIRQYLQLNPFHQFVQRVEFGNVAVNSMLSVQSEYSYECWVWKGHPKAQSLTSQDRVWLTTFMTV